MTEAQAVIKCPECGGTRYYKASKRKTAEGLVLQRYLCRECNHRFSEPNPYKLSRTNTSFNQVCAILQDTKNLDPQQKTDVVAISQNQAYQTQQGEIVDLIWYLKKKGKFSEQTIRSRAKRLKLLLKLGVSLHEPEQVRSLLAQDLIEVNGEKVKWSNGYKQTYVTAYGSYVEMLKLSWDPPVYETADTLPFVPTPREVDELIAGCSKKIGTCLLALKETGFRIGELWESKWTDLDEENFRLKCTAEKHGKARNPKISARLMERILSLPKTNDYIFGHGNLNAFRWKFDRQKHALSVKQANPRLKQIHFHTLRHFKATMEYAHTRNILHVKEVLGHRNINSTLIYTHLIPDNDDAEKYHHAVAKTTQEAGDLVDDGWQYVVTTPQGDMLFRKAKKPNELD